MLLLNYLLIDLYKLLRLFEIVCLLINNLMTNN